MPVHGRQLTDLNFELGGTEYRCQVRSAIVTNNSDEPEVLATFCPDGDYVAAAVGSFSLDMVFISDWSAGGISDFLWQNDGLTADFQLDLYSDTAGQHVRWTGTVNIKAPNVGGEAKATDLTEVSLLCVNKPVYSRVG